MFIAQEPNEQMEFISFFLSQKMIVVEIRDLFHQHRKSVTGIPWQKYGAVIL